MRYSTRFGMDILHKSFYTVSRQSVYYNWKLQYKNPKHTAEIVYDFLIIVSNCLHL